MTPPISTSKHLFLYCRQINCKEIRLSPSLFLSCWLSAFTQTVHVVNRGLTLGRLGMRALHVQMAAVVHWKKRVPLLYTCKSCWVAGSFFVRKPIKLIFVRKKYEKWNKFIFHPMISLMGFYIFYMLMLLKIRIIFWIPRNILTTIMHSHPAINNRIDLSFTGTCILLLSSDKFEQI